MPILTLFAERVSNVLSKDFSSLVYDQSIKHGEFLFGTDLAEKIEKQSKEQKLISKITTDSFPKGCHSDHGVGARSQTKHYGEYSSRKSLLQNRNNVISH